MLLIINGILTQVGNDNDAPVTVTCPSNLEELFYGADEGGLVTVVDVATPTEVGVINYTPDAYMLDRGFGTGFSELGNRKPFVAFGNFSELSDLDPGGVDSTPSGLRLRVVVREGTIDHVFSCFVCGNPTGYYTATDGELIVFDDENKQSIIAVTMPASANTITGIALGVDGEEGSFYAVFRDGNDSWGTPILIAAINNANVATTTVSFSGELEFREQGGTWSSSASVTMEGLSFLPEPYHDWCESTNTLIPGIPMEASVWPELYLGGWVTISPTPNEPAYFSEVNTTGLNTQDITTGYMDDLRAGFSGDYVGSYSGSFELIDSRDSIKICDITFANTPMILDWDTEEEILTDAELRTTIENFGYAGFFPYTVDAITNVRAGFTVTPIYSGGGFIVEDGVDSWECLMPDIDLSGA